MNNLFCSAKNATEKKAISPLIATVLLIAFTITVATIIANWVTTFTKVQTEEAGSKSTAKIKCAFGSLEIDSAKYNHTQTRLLVVLKNMAGDTDLQNITFNIILQNSSVYTYPASCNCGDETLNRGETKAYSNSSIQEGCSIAKLIVTTNCADAKDDVSSTGIDFTAC